MRILITGAAGFLGTNLANFLLGEGHTVLAVDNFSTGSRDNLALLEKFGENFEFHEWDVTTPEFLRYFSNPELGIDRVYHLACPTGVPNIQTLGEEMVDACSVGTKQVLEVARVHKARILFTSSSEVYGQPKVTPQQENYTGNVDPLGDRASYEEGKRFSETLVRLFVKKYAVQATIVRLFNVYGPYMSLVDDRVVPRFMVQALSNQPLTVQGDGSQKRTMCYVDDLIAGLMLVIEQGQPGEAYNLGSDQELNMLQLAEKVRDLVGSQSEIIHVPRPHHDHNSRMPVLDKMSALGWSQKVSLDEGLAKTLENFKERWAASTAHAPVATTLNPGIV